MPYFVYIVKGTDDSLYTGYTVDVEKRINTHNKSGGAKALKGKLPVQLVHSEIFKTKSEALKREAEIKSWPRIKKLELLAKSTLLRG